MRSLHLHSSLSLLLALLLSLAAPLASQASRLAPTASYQVNSNANLDDLNPGDGICLTSASNCTLVAAVEEANADGVNSRITFAQMFAGSNAFNGCVLPALTADYTTIDASSQWDSVRSQPGVELYGGFACYSIIAITGDYNNIQGILFGGSAIGVTVNGEYNVIGTVNQAGRGNTFVSSTGVQMDGHNNLVTGNQIGMLQESLVCPFSGPTFGVVASGDNSVENNLIDCNQYGIELRGSGTHVNFNTIGMNSNHSNTRPNLYGIRLNGADGNTIDGNYIAGNTQHGIDLESSDNNVFTNNQIGLYGGIGNDGDGIYINNSSGNQIGQPNKGNTIYNNGTDGLEEASGSLTLQGNFIGHNGGSGVDLRSDWNTIGGGNPGESNYISGNSSYGILLDGASHNNVYGNCIGFDITACAYADGNKSTGIMLMHGASNNSIGGSGMGNWVGNNLGSGIQIQDAASVSNYVQGNIVGAPAGFVWQAGNTLNGIRLSIGTAQNIIGGLGAGQGNIILGNLMSGLALDDSDSNWIFGNKIGTDGNGHNWGNTLFGIRINNGAASNIMLVNKVAYNGGTSGLPGIWITGIGSISNPISTNSIFSHSGKGIELESDGNNELAAPAITIATCTVIGGQACPNCSIELYSDTYDEGQRFLGFTNADGSGAFAWTGRVMGPNVTALATDASQNTSEFSAPYTVGACPAAYLPLISK